MSDASTVTRDAIVQTLTAALEPLPFVDAMWEGGAAAFQRLDEWSDIDLYVVAADDRVPETFQAVEGALTRLSPIQRRYEPVWPPESGIAQAFYRLERASEYLLVDLAVLKRSAPDKFLETRLHGQALFAFNKEDRVKIPPLDVDGFVKKLLERRDRLALRIALFSPFVSKEIHRGNTLGALEAYQRLVLDALVQTLWMRYAPAHYGFGARYGVHELPGEAVRRLEDLSFVGSLQDLTEKYPRAVEWFQEVVVQIHEDEVRGQLRVEPGLA